MPRRKKMTGRGCLCPDELTYHASCCDDEGRNQGIGTWIHNRILNKIRPNDITSLDFQPQLNSETFGRGAWTLRFDVPEGSYDEALQFDLQITEELTGWDAGGLNVDLQGELVTDYDVNPEQVTYSYTLSNSGLERWRARFLLNGVYSEWSDFGLFIT